MRIAPWLAFAGLTLLAIPLCQVLPPVTDKNDQELAQLLGSMELRDAAVDRVVASGHAKIPLLLSWTRHALRHPRDHILFDELLHLSMAEIFGRLRTAEAIPFLIRNINIREFVPLDPWTRGPRRIAEDYPAAAALIEIGPQAARATIEAFPGLRTHEERLVAVFVISQIDGVPEAEELFRNIRTTEAPGSFLAYWAMAGRKSRPTR